MQKEHTEDRDRHYVKWSELIYTHMRTHTHKEQVIDVFNTTCKNAK